MYSMLWNLWKRPQTLLKSAQWVETSPFFLKKTLLTNSVHKSRGYPMADTKSTLHVNYSTDCIVQDPVILFNADLLKDVLRLNQQMVIQN